MPRSPFRHTSQTNAQPTRTHHYTTTSTTHHERRSSPRSSFLCRLHLGNSSYVSIVALYLSSLAVSVILYFASSRIGLWQMLRLRPGSTLSTPITTKRSLQQSSTLHMQCLRPSAVWLTRWTNYSMINNCVNMYNHKFLQPIDHRRRILQPRWREPQGWMPFCARAWRWFPQFVSNCTVCSPFQPSLLEKKGINMNSLCFISVGSSSMERLNPTMKSWTRTMTTVLTGMRWELELKSWRTSARP